MRVCFITTSFPAYKGHSQSPFVYKLAEALAKRGIKLDIICPETKEAKVADEEMVKNMFVHRIEYRKKEKQKITLEGGIASHLKKSPLAWIELFWLALGLKRKAEEYMQEADLIHAQWTLSGFIGLMLKKIYRKPLIVTERGSALNMGRKIPIIRSLLKRVYQKADVVTTNNFEQARIIEQMGISKGKIQVIPNGIDLNMFRVQGKKAMRKKLHLPQEKILVIYGGWFVTIKGVDLLVDAFVKIASQAKNTVLILLGDGLLKEELQQKVRRHELEDRVIFRPMVQRSQVGEYLNAADMLVLPSRTEGKPNIVTEALACNLPVIATKVGGVPEIIKDRYNGLLVMPESSAAIAEAIIELVGNRKLYNKLKGNARISVEKSGLTWEKAAELYQDMYLRLAGRDDRSFSARKDPIAR